jgi:hypothetical protein
MFPNLKSLLSSHAAPGSAIASAAPFSFFARFNIQASAGDDAKRIEAIASELMEVDRLLDADDFKAGRERLKDVLRGLTE